MKLKKLHAIVAIFIFAILVWIYLIQQNYIISSRFLDSYSSDSHLGALVKKTTRYDGDP